MQVSRGNCFLCGEECEKHTYPRDDYIVYMCPYCGEFGCSHEAEDQIGRIALGKEKLAMIITARTLAGLPKIVISNENTEEGNNYVWLTFKELLGSFPKPEQIIDRVLQNLSHMVTYITDVVAVMEKRKYIFYATSIDGLFYILKQLHALGYTNSLSQVPGTLRISSSGWERISQIKSGLVSTGQQAFTAMWFHPSMQEYYENGIKPAIESDGETRSVRIDTIEHNNKICDEIVKEIRKSRYVVADFTGNRGGVYFEAGYALGIGLPVIYTVHESGIDSVHFDTRQYNHIVYRTSEDLLDKLRNRIAATIIL